MNIAYNNPAIPGILFFPSDRHLSQEEIGQLQGHKYVGISLEEGKLNAAFDTADRMANAGYRAASMKEICDIFWKQINYTKTHKEILALAAYVTLISTPQNTETSELIETLKNFALKRLNIVTYDPFVLHLQRKNFKEAAELLTCYNINTVSPQGKTALHQAVENAKRDGTDAVRFLLQHGADVFKKDKGGLMPIHYSAVQNDLYCFQILVQHNPNQLNIRANMDMTIAHFAAAYNSDDVLNDLIKTHNVQLDVTDKEGKTPFHYACFLRSFKQPVTDKEGEYRPNKVIALLMQAKANFNMQDHAGITPFHWLAMFAPQEILASTLPKVSNHMVLDINNKTPLHWAICQRNLGNVTLLLNVALRDRKLNTENPDRLERTLVREALDTAILTIDKDSVDSSAPPLEILRMFLKIFNFPSSVWQIMITQAILQANAIVFETIYKLAIEFHPNKPYLHSFFLPDESDGGNNIFHYAATSNSTQILEILLKDSTKKAALSLTNRKGLLPLHLALSVANPTEQIKANINLLLHEFDPKNCPQGVVTTLLIFAAKNDHWDVVGWLILKYNETVAKENINQSDPTTGNTLLHVLIQKAPQASGLLYALLYRPDVDLSAKNLQGFTPLHLCLATVGSKMNLELLLIALNCKNQLQNALMAETNRPGFTPLLLAIDNIKREHLKPEELHNLESLVHFHKRFPYLQTYYEDNGRDPVKCDWHPLLLAAFHGNKHVLKLLFDLYPELIHRPNRSGLTPLHYAVKHNDVGILELFVGAKVIIDARAEKGHTPLHYAAELNANLGVQFLLQNGANPNAQTILGIAPLHFSVKAHDSLSMIALLEAGADPNIQNTKGQSPLHIAIKHEAVLCMKTLLNGVTNKKTGLRSFANPHITNKAGLSPIHLAAQSEVFHPEPGRRGFTYILAELKHFPLSFDIPDESGKTPLHHAVIKGCLKNVLLLISGFADAQKSIEHKDRTGKNAFIHAYENRQYHLMPHLIKFALPPIYTNLLIELGKEVSLDPIGGSAWRPLMKGRTFTQVFTLTDLVEVCLLFHDVNFLKLIFKELDPGTFDAQLNIALEALKQKKHPEQGLQWLKSEASFFKLSIEINHLPSPLMPKRIPLSKDEWNTSKACLITAAEEIVAKQGKEDYFDVQKDFLEVFQTYLTNIDRRLISGMTSHSQEDQNSFYIDIKCRLKSLTDCLQLAKDFAAVDAPRVSQALIFIYESTNTCNEGYAEGAGLALEMYRGLPGFPEELVNKEELSPEKTAFIRNEDKVELLRVRTHYHKAKMKVFNFIGTFSTECAHMLISLQKTKSLETIDPGVPVHVGNQIKRILRHRTIISWTEIGTGADDHIADIAIDPMIINNSFDKFFTASDVLNKFKNAVKRGNEVKKSLTEIGFIIPEIRNLKLKMNKISESMLIADDNAKKALEAEKNRLELRIRELEIAKEQGEKSLPELKKELHRLLSKEELRVVLEVAVGAPSKSESTKISNTKSLEEHEIDNNNRLELINTTYYDDDFEINDRGLITILKELGVYRIIDKNNEEMPYSSMLTTSATTSNSSSLARQSISSGQNHDRDEWKDDSGKERKHWD